MSFFQHKIKISLHAVIFCCIVVMAIVITTPHASAAPTVAITSPAAGANIPVGQPVTVSGTASAYTTVLVKNGSSVVGSTVSNGSGQWSVVVSGMPAGPITLTAEAIQNGTYGYFGTMGSPYQIHRLRLSDMALNPGGGLWPVTSSILPLFPSRADNASSSFYYVHVGNQIAPAKFTISAPADPTPATGYPALTTAYSGDSNADGTKFYLAASEIGSISVIDISSNTQLSLISIGGVAQAVTRGPNGNMYVTDVTNSAVKIINPSTDTVIGSFPVSCPTAGSLGKVFYAHSNDYVLVTCSLDGIIHKYRSSDNALIDSWDISAYLPGISNLEYSLDAQKLYVSGLVTMPGTNQIVVVDTNDGQIITTIALTAETISGTLSPDGQYLFVPTPGTTFTTMNIDVISTLTNTVIANIDTTAFGPPGVVVFDLAERASANVTFNMVQATLADTGGSWTWSALVIATMLVIGFGLMVALRRQDASA